MASGIRLALAIDFRQHRVKAIQHADQGIDLFLGQGAEQAAFTFQRGGQDRVVQISAFWGQGKNLAAPVLFVGCDLNKPLGLHVLDAATNRAFVQTDHFDDTVGCDLGLYGQKRDNAPFGDANVELFAKFG